MADLQNSQSFGVFFSNLEDEVPDMIVAMIISLILQMTGIRVQKHDVGLRYSYPSECNVANVNLHDPKLQQQTVETLQRMNDCHIPRGLVKSGRVLRVNYFRSTKPEKDLISLPSKNQTSETTGQRYLVKYQQMGSETRSLEFKGGQGDILEAYMRKLLSKYICGFLNSEGGELMIGVDDEGVVQGINCDHKTEDSFRIMLDQLIHFFDPPVLPPMYHLEFVPVRDERDRMTDLRVISIDVSKGRSDVLYETPKGEAYIRRDGSVQGPLRAKDVQAWCHMKNSQENQDKEKLFKHQIDILETRLQNIESSKGQGGQAEQTQMGSIPTNSLGARLSPAASSTAISSQGSQGQGNQAEQTQVGSIPTNSLGARLSPAASSTAISPEGDRKNNLKKTNSKLCSIL